ncbi:MAG: EamA family transporter, partial [Pseudomonadota bacterium]
PASTAAAFINLVPVIGVATSFLLGERPALMQLAGGGLAIAGVLLSSGMGGKRIGHETREEKTVSC